MKAFNCARLASRVAPLSRPLRPLRPMARPFSSSFSQAPAVGKSSLLFGSLLLLSVGALAAFSSAPSSSAAAKPAEEVKAPALPTASFEPLEVVSNEEYNHNTRVIKVRFPEGLKEEIPVSSCFLFRYTDEEGKAVVRPYTPVDSLELQEEGTLSFLIKGYAKGKMSKHLHELKEGEKLEVKGPILKRPYKANEHQVVTMLAGGTGITPMLQILLKSFDDPEDKTKFNLVFFNATEEDILLREELWRLQSASNFRITVDFWVDRKKSDDPFVEEGYLDETRFKQLLFPPWQPGHFVYVCGPPAQMEYFSGNKAKDLSQGPLTGLLAELGFSPDQVYKF